MDVSVFGLGYVGSVTAACLASRGHRVVGVDVNPDKVEAINEGQSPILEPGLDRLLNEAVRTGHLSATMDAETAVVHGDICFICVGTPSASNGSLDLAYVERACADIARPLAGAEKYKVVALRSTVLPGTIAERVLPILRETSGKRENADYGLVVNPEFLREGSAIRDFQDPPFTLIGQSDERAGDALAALYADVTGPILRTEPDTACMVKYASNAFHAVKVAFANEIGQLCKWCGIDGTQVMDIFCRDTKLNISSRYLEPGFAFGGSCLPKDLRALLYIGRHSDLTLPLLESILPSNEQQIARAAELVLGDGRRRVGVIGLSFKPGTDDLRESPVVELVEILSGKGMQVRIYDHNVKLSKLVGGNKAYIERVLPHISAMMSESMEEVVAASDVIVVTHSSQNGQDRLGKMLQPHHLLIDLVKAVPNGDQCVAVYEGICW